MSHREKNSIRAFFADIEQKFNNKEDQRALCQSDWDITSQKGAGENLISSCQHRTCNE
jgi:hypothetical protein